MIRSPPTGMSVNARRPSRTPPVYRFGAGQNRRSSPSPLPPPAPPPSRLLWLSCAAPNRLSMSVVVVGEPGPEDHPRKHISVGYSTTTPSIGARCQIGRRSRSAAPAGLLDRWPNTRRSRGRSDERASPGPTHLIQLTVPAQQRRIRRSIARKYQRVLSAPRRDRRRIRLWRGRDERMAATSRWLRFDRRAQRGSSDRRRKEVFASHTREMTKNRPRSVYRPNRPRRLQLIVPPYHRAALPRSQAHGYTTTLHKRIGHSVRRPNQSRCIAQMSSRLTQYALPTPPTD
uniref:Uncharacterized protein n=1 Tax=Plectus sambesii TaxID=2011161 RepID=A0A914VWS4_9BILA